MIIPFLKTRHGHRRARIAGAGYVPSQDRSEVGEPCSMNAYGSAFRRAVIADLEAVRVQRASARRHQLSVATTASAATGSGSSSWIVDTWLAAAAPPMPIHNAGAA